MEESPSPLVLKYVPVRVRVEEPDTLRVRLKRSSMELFSELTGIAYQKRPGNGKDVMILRRIPWMDG